MDRRTAKRMVCEEVASDLIMRLEDGRIGSAFSGDDRGRYETAAAELAEELLRRAGVWKEGHDPDPRQSTIYDFLEMPEVGTGLKVDVGYPAAPLPRDG